jgi:hypothetical protein
MDKYNGKDGRIHHCSDKTMTEIPLDLSHPIVHIEFSRDLFGDEFHLFDQLYQLTSYDYSLRSDSIIVSLSKALHWPGSSAECQQSYWRVHHSTIFREFSNSR